MREFVSIGIVVDTLAEALIALMPEDCLASTADDVVWTGFEVIAERLVLRILPSVVDARNVEEHNVGVCIDHFADYVSWICICESERFRAFVV